VNSGRATREHSIEETAHKTNLEAADEVGRQLRLRDLAGLIVIDFIDMEDHRNDRNVEKRLHNAVKNDRARIQIGKISQFGLMEMSRQRLRAGVVAGSTVPCPHCNGQGIVRSVESTALRVLRGIEDEAQKLKASAIKVKVPSDVALYTLNQKRRELARIEEDYGMTVSFEPTESVHAGDFEIERTTARDPDDKPKILTQMETAFVPEEIEEEEPEIVEEEDEEEIETEDRAGATSEAATDERPRREPRPEGDDGGPRKRRRRGGRNRNRRDGNEARPQQNGHQHTNTQQQSADAAKPSEEADGDQGAIASGAQDGSSQNGETGEGGQRRRRRRRGRRGRRDHDENGTAQSYQGDGVPVDASVREEGEPTSVMPNSSSTPVWSLTQQETPAPRAEAPAPTPAEPARKGWWQRAFKRED
jgi:ribonuclease E